MTSLPFSARFLPPWKSGSLPVFRVGSTPVEWGVYDTHMAESKSTVRQRNLRSEIMRKLGERCSNPDCRWHNDDGTRGCTDIRALQIDHVGGGGSMELRSGHGVGLAHLYRVRTDLKYSALAGTPSSYQLLCANCNWIKRHANGEARGADQHKRPARLRLALQVKGRPARRVKRTNAQLDIGV